MKVVGFTQHRNELSNGNLHNWLRCMDMCERIYVYDQGSNDGSLEILRANPKVVLIESPTNDFRNEIICKKALLEKLLAEQPDTDWIFWLDCDYLLNNKYLKDDFAEFYAALAAADNAQVDGLIFGHYNLWRSDTYYRIDDNYHWANGPGRISVWKNNGKLNFAAQSGLHKVPYPAGLNKTQRIDCELIHRGFATDFQIMAKYDNYKSFGQKGWDLERLLSEKGLTVKPLPAGMLPEWYEGIADKSDPRTKEKIASIYARK